MTESTDRITIGIDPTDKDISVPARVLYCTAISGEGTGRANAQRIADAQAVHPATPFEWSDDCLSCLCNLPHTSQEHYAQVFQAFYAMREEMEMRKRDRPHWAVEEWDGEI